MPKKSPESSSRAKAASSTTQRRSSVVSTDSSDPEEEYENSESDGSSQYESPSINPEQTDYNLTLTTNPRTSVAGRPKQQVIIPATQETDQSSNLEEQEMDLTTSHPIHGNLYGSQKKEDPRMSRPGPSREFETPRSARQGARAGARSPMSPRPGTSRGGTRPEPSPESPHPGTSREPPRRERSRKPQRPEPSRGGARPGPSRESSPSPEPSGEGRRKKTAPKSQKTRLLQEVRKLQNSATLLIPRLPFSRLLREVIINTGGDYRITKEAVEGIQEAAEMYIVLFFEDANRLALHAKRVTLMPRDMKLIYQLRINWGVSGR